MDIKNYQGSLPPSFFGNLNPYELIEKFGSPLFVYNEGVLRKRCKELVNLIDHPGFKPCYSTKANGNPHLLSIIKEEGFFADAMSPGELALTNQAGFDHTNTFYICNNVSSEEFKNIYKKSLHVSLDSISQLETFAEAVPNGNVMLRLNPPVGTGHHKKVITAGKDTKFGISESDIPLIRNLLRKYELNLVGFNQHVGSLFLEPESFLAAVDWMLNTAESFPEISNISFGGGFGIPYHKVDGQARLDVSALKKELSQKVLNWCVKTGYSGNFYIEPGRYITAECGVLLGSVHAIKETENNIYVGTDIGFTTLIRPALYNSYHEIKIFPSNSQKREVVNQTIVGNICESGDVLAEARALPKAHVGDVLAVFDAGAYGQSMSSNYNQRLRPAEVLIEQDGSARCIRLRDTIADIIKPYDC